MATAVFLLIVSAGAGLFVYQTFLRDKWIRRKPFPADWQAILAGSLPIYSTLGADQQRKLQQLIQLFIARKKFYGCAGLTITDEIRITIAGQACLLLLNKGWQTYPKLLSVLVYPSAFRAQRQQMQDDGTVAMAGHDLLGESWSNGKVILSWDDVEKGVSDFSDGHNVVLHEFAHQLDGLSGSTNGAPPLRSNSYQSWARVFTENFEDLRHRSQHGLATVMDQYGTTNPAEFFAVATEAFFEQPRQLHKVRPELFAELQAYYRLDPREWEEENESL
ncbi:MAG: M90 family metallopeptidase [Halioglobus sp.]